MKQFLFLLAFLSYQLSSAQCYIQYGYDASGNRTSRTYIGGCGKPAPSVNGDHALLTAQSDPIAVDEQRISETTAGVVTSYHLYPNPSYGLINLDVPNIALTGSKYVIYNPSGAVVKSAPILTTRSIVDISDILAGSYVISVIDVTGRRLYTTQIIKI
jgi:hypothetical protein